LAPERRSRITVYDGVVGRTQIYLGAEELKLLDRMSSVTGASRSELIRRSIRGAYGERTKSERLSALDASAGAWSGRGISGADYVDSVRGDYSERRRRLDRR